MDKNEMNTGTLSPVVVSESNGINSTSDVENSNMISTATANDAVCNDKVEINKENLMKKENTKSAGAFPPANMANLGKNIDKNSMEYLNENWCINCVEEAIHFIEMSGLQGELLDTIKGCLPQYCRDTFADTLQDMGLWDSDIEFIFSNRDDFETFESIKEHVECGGSIGDWTLLDLDEVKEWCEGKSVLVDDEEMSLIDFLNLESITVSEFMEWQEDWGCSDDPLAWHMTSHLRLDSFFDVYGEAPNGQWEARDWDGSKRIDQQSSVA